MGEIKPFKQYVSESVEADENSEKMQRLRKLGLAPTEPFADRLDKMIDEWGGDPEVNAAIQVLISKANQFTDKWIDYNNQEDQDGWDNYVSNLWEVPTNELGWFEYIIAGELL